MDTQLKQRLTGAVILVALVVLIVPAVLTGPQLPQVPQLQPGEAGPLRSYTIDLSGASLPRAIRGAASVAPVAATPPPAQPTEPPTTVPQATAPQTTAPLAVVPKAVVPPPQATTPASVQRDGFAVQLGSFANVDTANRLARDLRAAGFSVSLASVRAGGRELQRVRVGPVADRPAAEALLARLVASGHKGPIVPYP